MLNKSVCLSVCLWFTVSEHNLLANDVTNALSINIIAIITNASLEYEIHSSAVIVVTDESPKDTSSVVSSDEDDSYSVCAHEAIACYQRVIDILDRSRCSSTDDTTRSELNANTLSRLADCYLLTNQFHRAIECYELSLPHFRSAAVGLTPLRRREMALLNAHVLGQLGTVNYILSNYMRAATVYEMSAMLRQHLADASTESESETTTTKAAARSMVCLEAAWMRSMYGLTLSALGRHHQCVVWSLRAFAEYIRVLRGQIITVQPPVRRWFVVETLFSLGQSYGVIGNGEARAVHYLTLAKNLIRAAPEEDMDIQQTFKVRTLMSSFFRCQYQTTYVTIGRQFHQRASCNIHLLLQGAR